MSSPGQIPHLRKQLNSLENEASEFTVSPGPRSAAQGTSEARGAVLSLLTKVGPPLALECPFLLVSHSPCCSKALL